MEEASTFLVGYQLRALFVTLILDGAPAAKLWRYFKINLIEDLTSTLSTDDAIQSALREIDLKLQLHGKSNVQVNLPNVIHTHTEFERMRSAFNPHQCMEYANLHENRLTTEQRQVHTNVIEAVRNNKPQPFMIDAPAGTGKIYTEKYIASRLRGENKTVLIVPQQVLQRYNFRIVGLLIPCLNCPWTMLSRLQPYATLTVKHSEQS